VPTLDVVSIAAEPFTMLFTVLESPSGEPRLLRWPEEPIPGLEFELPGEDGNPSILSGGHSILAEPIRMWG